MAPFFIARPLSGLALAVEHPAGAEPVHQRTEIGAPEHLLQRHLHLAALPQGRKQAIGLGPAVRLQVEVSEIPSFLETQIIPSVRVYKRCCFR